MCLILILFLWQNICRTACTLLLLSFFSFPLAAWVLTVDHLAERIRSRLAGKTKQDYLGKMAANASHASNDEFRSSRSRWMNKAFSSKYLIVFFFAPASLSCAQHNKRHIDSNAPSTMCTDNRRTRNDALWFSSRPQFHDGQLNPRACFHV